MVTGVVLGIRGIVKADAVLQALNLYFPRAGLPREIFIEKDEYICFISGLEIGHPHMTHQLLYVFVDFLLGGLESEENGVASKIVRLVLLGDSIYKPVDARTVDRKAVGDNELKGFNEMASSLKQLDSIVAEFSGIFPVDVIPGEMDPTNASLPQQPLSPYLFPKANVYSALQSVPNPYEFSLDGVSFLCTSGQNINSMAQYVPEDRKDLDLMGLTLKYRHLAPNAPDGLQCIPMQNTDPFILKNLPNVYVAGCMRSFDTQVSNDGVRIVSLPKFCNSKSFVLMNRFSLETQLVSMEDYFY